jgi:hypothetical protein
MVLNKNAARGRSQKERLAALRRKWCGRPIADVPGAGG